MLRRVHINGYIEVAELPEIGSVVTVGSLRVEVTGAHTDKQQRRGDVVELVLTAPTKVLDGAKIDKVEEAEDGGLLESADD